MTPVAGINVRVYRALVWTVELMMKCDILLRLALATLVILVCEVQYSDASPDDCEYFESSSYV